MFLEERLSLRLDHSSSHRNSEILIMSRMDDSKLRLQWRDHGNELSRLSRDVFCREDLSDVTLTCRGGAPFSAHKMILAAASTYFRNFFMEVRGKINQHQVIFMKDIEPSEMEYLLQFIYLGEVDIPSLELERLITISKDLGIIGLDAVKKEEDVVEERRVLHAKKRKSQATPKSPDPMTPKLAKVEEDPIYDDDTAENHQVPFDEYIDGGEDDQVVEDDVRDSKHEDDSGVDEGKDPDFSLTSARRKSSGGGKKLSPIWNHFNVSVTDLKYAQCLHCDKLISRGSSIPGKMTISGMKNHFRTQHQDVDQTENSATPQCPEVV